jgi:hypothetical protein
MGNMRTERSRERVELLRPRRAPVAQRVEHSTYPSDRMGVDLSFFLFLRPRRARALDAADSRARGAAAGAPLRLQASQLLARWADGRACACLHESRAARSHLLGLPPLEMSGHQGVERDGVGPAGPSGAQQRAKEAHGRVPLALWTRRTREERIIQ